MFKKNYLLLFIFLLILIPLIKANTITASAVFEIKNSPPIIESINNVNNILQIKVSDPNGYKDIIYDGYVKIIVNNNRINATFISGSGINANYEYTIPNGINKLVIEASDGRNVITNEYNLNENNLITGNVVLNTKSAGTGFFQRLLDKIFSWFK